MDGAILTGRLPVELANRVSDALKMALQRGAATDEACCVAAQVVADYWRLAYGDAALTTLSRVILMRGEVPLPVPNGRAAARADDDGNPDLDSVPSGPPPQTSPTGRSQRSRRGSLS